MSKVKEAFERKISFRTTRTSYWIFTIVFKVPGWEQRRGGGVGATKGHIERGFRLLKLCLRAGTSSRRAWGS